MSRSARTSAGSSSMPVATHSPADRDVVMGPPPLPPQIAVSAPGDSKGRDREGIEAAEKYKRLKRKYFELEEKYKDAMSELRGSGERSVKLRTERAYLLDRILELEAQKQPTGPVYPGFQQPLSSAYPRSLTAPSAQKRFIVNLDGTMGEAENEDYNLDPLLQSKHVGPIARKRIEAEQKERQEEEQREQKKTVRQPRKRNGKEKEKEKEKEIPLAADLEMHDADSPPPSQAPVLLATNGQRLRIKPPAPPSLSLQPEPVRPPSPARTSNSTPPSPQQDRHQPQRHEHDDEPRRAGSSVAGTPGIGPVPGPFMMQTPLNTPVPTAGAGGSRGKPKRLKAHTVTSKSYSIPMVPRDKAGRPLLPLNVGIMTVLNLGDVCMREHFHTERYIFPVGYEVTRRYLSTVDPLNEAVYHCTILDGGDGPKFQIVASDDSDKPVIAGTATGAWSVIVRAANLIRNRQHSNSVSGPDFFGLGQNTIKHLIQELSGADRLKDYVWQNFVEGG
ncbi:hypothetical protein BC835DRAFT_1289824 [Cytidiella melzeri]|nr:hypothetical protein BC835DRAFT_1289824 [Cytidiella melzeri]